MSDVTQTIKDKLDLVDYISRYVKLKKTGQNFSGLCPFHREKTPSFFVSPQRQSWHCFGCGKGGDIFSFVMEREGLDFYGALSLLAQETNTQLPKKQDPQVTDRRERLYSLLAMAQSFYYNKLSASTHAKSYLTNRGITDESISKFGLGYAPDSWNALGLFLLNKGYSKKELHEAGLIILKNNTKTGDRDWYDRFRNRIMFPINDRIGRVVGFSGRILKKDENTAKYVNSPETELFKKSRLLFGFNLAKQAITKSDYVVIVEGQLDVISLHQIGIHNVVAPQGSAFTRDQLKLINRLTKRAILFFDDDSAGLRATLKSLRILLENGFDVKVAVPSAGKDPDEAAQKDKALTQKDIATAKHYFNYLLDYSVSHSNDDDPDRNTKISAFILPFIAIVPNSVQRETLTQKLAEYLHVSTQSLMDELAKIMPKQGQQSSLRIPRIKKKRRTTRWESLFLELTAMLLQLPKSLESDAMVVDILKPLTDIQPEGLITTLAIKTVELLTSTGRIDQHELNKSLSQKETKLADILAVKDLKKVVTDEELFIRSLEHITKDIEIIRTKRRIKELVAKKQPDSIQEVNLLTKRLRDLQ